ncbi:TRAM domain-containing protein [Rhodococcus sp. X156]|uniref:class I SAM-dependent RNA methyltransferase n=1 Tax=Rhodococcus sp. X156 TaxID=2499145 RepID=UPI000FD8E43D|nr:TRAM domain-containing protein [Rhodococcus sp. X156]
MSSTAAPGESLDWTGETLELELGAPGHGGFCVARHEGRVVFVRHGLPGERVRALVTEDRGGSFCRADAVAVLTASPDRVVPRCPVAGPGGCGGCDFQHAALPAQRQMKAMVVAEQLRRLGGLDLTAEDVVVEELPGAPDGLGWRSRVRMAVTADGQPGFHPHRSNDVIPVLGCPQAVPHALDDVVGQQWTPGADLQVVRDGAGEQHVVELTTPQRPQRGRRKPRPVAQLRRGSATATEQAAGRTWAVSADGFWQAHVGAAEVYAQVVAELADAPTGGTAWDLYSGVGLFSAVLAEQVGAAGTVVAVESSRQAVADGTAALADLPQVRMVAGQVEQQLRTLPVPVDVVVLDPPRSGAGRSVVEAITAAEPTRIVYVACDPAALGRDVALLGAQGYRLSVLRAFDAFPMTHHVECIALFQR